jgi:hypothetical protein
MEMFAVARGKGRRIGEAAVKKGHGANKVVLDRVGVDWFGLIKRLGRG